jgi:hypothetical protein
MRKEKELQHYSHAYGPAEQRPEDVCVLSVRINVDLDVNMEILTRRRSVVCRDIMSGLAVCASTA